MTPPGWRVSDPLLASTVVAMPATATKSPTASKGFMARIQPKTVPCQRCKQRKKVNEVIPGELVRASVAASLRKKYPEWSPNGFICLADLNHFGAEFLEDGLEEQREDHSTLEQEVVSSLKEHGLLPRNLSVEFERDLIFSERVANRVAEFGGSCRFVILFGAVLIDLDRRKLRRPLLVTLRPASVYPPQLGVVVPRSRPDPNYHDESKPAGGILGVLTAELMGPSNHGRRRWVSSRV